MRDTDVLKHECPKDECGRATNARWANVAEPRMLEEVVSMRLYVF
jgi:hypothetical protein